jgi:hypothetical protein
MIICFFKEQAKLLIDQISFEVDMSFKRIRQKDLNEIIFASYLEAHGKSMFQTPLEPLLHTC